jgi:hypothetical protein
VLLHVYTFNAIKSVNMIKSIFCRGIRFELIFRWINKVSSAIVDWHDDQNMKIPAGKRRCVEKTNAPTVNLQTMGGLI